MEVASYEDNKDIMLFESQDLECYIPYSFEMMILLKMQRTCLESRVKFSSVG